MLQPFNLDPRVVRQQFDRRAARFESNDYLLREVERRMFERLDVVKIVPAKILDLGCGLGAGVAELARRYPQAETVGLDFAPKMIDAAKRRVLPTTQGLFSRFMKSMGAAASSRISFEEADLANLPTENESVDLLWSNLVLHWLGVPEPALLELYRVAKPGALLMFSVFGVDTFKEIRPPKSGPVDLMRFRDMHDWGDALVEVGFAEPVMDMERITLSYAEPKKLLKDLHQLGGNALGERRSTLSPRSLSSDLLHKLSSGSVHGQPFTLTIEVIYGHAWVPPKKRRKDGLATIEFLPKRP
jgi:malonyl-CoA O-methyltransferase